MWSLSSIFKLSTAKMGFFPGNHIILIQKNTGLCKCPVFFRTFCCYVYRHRIWTITTSRTPYHDQLFAIHLLYRCTRQVVWSHFIVVAYHLLQDIIYFFHWHALYGTNSHACLIVSIYTNYDISTAKVVKVVGESTYTVIPKIRNL